MNESLRRFSVVGHLRHDHEGTVVAYKHFATLEKALREIAAGDGYYGAQAKEYKDIAKAALATLSPQRASGDV